MDVEIDLNPDKVRLCILKQFCRTRQGTALALVERCSLWMVHFWGPPPWALLHLKLINNWTTPFLIIRPVCWSHFVHDILLNCWTKQSKRFLILTCSSMSNLSEVVQPVLPFDEVLDSLVVSTGLGLQARRHHRHQAFPESTACKI